jgi:indolepyruvate ferredoxin oxidoreductase beta subunit
MKTDIIIAGVGGQGILSIATAIGTSALNNNLNVKQAETHGMSQRGGDVVSHLRLSDKQIYSDLIAHGEANLIMAVEPMESLRYLPFLSKSGYIVANTTPFLNISNYPDLNELLTTLRNMKNVIPIDAEKIALDLGSKLASNIVVLGAGSLFINDISFESLKESIVELFSRKGKDIVELNIAALEAGRSFSKNIIENR